MTYLSAYYTQIQNRTISYVDPLAQHLYSNLFYLFSESYGIFRMYLLSYLSRSLYNNCFTNTSLFQTFQLLIDKTINFQYHQIIESKKYGEHQFVKNWA